MASTKNFGQHDRTKILGCELIDRVLVVLRSNQLNIATFVLQIGHVCVSHLVNKSGNNNSGPDNVNIMTLVYFHDFDLLLSYIFFKISPPSLKPFFLFLVHLSVFKLKLYFTW